jgi:SpoVK/Ycf46/Vps4 family AAA+-type ATPase
MRKIILAGPGNRDPSPVELATAMEAHPQAEMEKGAKLLVEYDVEDSAEKPIELPNGFYNYEQSNHFTPDRLEPMALRQDIYHQLPGVFDRLSDDIHHFLQGEAVYQELGLQYRRGILLYGPPGNGKTSLIREILRTHFSQDAIVVFIDRIPSRHFVRVMRETLSHRLKVIILEELAAVLKGSALDHALAFLDGEISLGNCLILATTNYPERLPGNIVDRPSRFDRLYYIRDPNENCRKIFLQKYLGAEVSDAEIRFTKGMSAAALREVCLLVKLRKIAFTEAARSLKRHKEIVKREFGAIKEIGFAAGSSDDYDD